MERNFYFRYRHVIVWGALLLFPVILWGARQGMRKSENSFYDWLPARFEEADHYRRYRSHFGGDGLVMVSWPGCSIDDPRLDRFEEALNNNSNLFQHVFTGPSLLEELTSPPIEISREEAISRLEGIVIGPDHKTSCAVIFFTDEGYAGRHATVDKVYELAEKATGLPAEEIHMGGPPVINTELDRESASSFRRLSWIAYLTSLCLCWWFFRSFRLLAIVFVVALYAQAASVAAVYFTGSHMDAVLITLPVLIYVLAISGGVHLVNYYLDELAEKSDRDTPLRAVHRGWVPIALASLTTMFGLGALSASEIVPIQNFGKYAALGMILLTICLLGILPAALQIFPLKVADPRYFKQEKEPMIHWWTICGRLTTVHFRSVSVVCTVVMLLLGIGLSQVKTTSKLLELFTADTKISQDYRWLEDHIGPLVPLEVVVYFQEDNQLNMLERMEMVREIEREIAQLELVGGTISPATFAPEIPPAQGVRHEAERRVMRRKFETNRDRFQKANFIDDLASGGAAWRISNRVFATGEDVNYAAFLERVRKLTRPIAARYRENGVDKFEVQLTGSIPLVYLTQRELLNDLVRSFMVAFGLIAIVMIVLLRSLFGGLGSMIPNAFPAVVVFGAMGWLGFRVDIGIMMTASVALGVAVDDTLHYLTWYARGIRRDMSRPEAVKWAFDRCARAMTQTTFIVGLGMLVYYFSTFVPIVHFAMLILILLVTALIGDLLFLPALLVGPLGRFFTRPLIAKLVQKTVARTQEGVEQRV